MPKLYRQGDVLLKEVYNLPEGLLQLNTKVVAVGEETGHEHKLVGGEVLLLQHPDSFSASLYVKVVEKTQLEHPEHKPIEIEPGIYKIEMEREFDAFEEVVRRVKD